MAKQQRHTIRRVGVTVEAPWEASPGSLQHQFGSALRGEFLSRLSQRLDALIPAAHYHQIGQLDIDLDLVDDGQLGPAFEEQLLTQLLEAVQAHLSALLPSANPGTASEGPVASNLEAMRHYLAHGGLPGWYTLGQTHFVRAVEDLLAQAGTATVALLQQHAGQLPALTRLWRLSASIQAPLLALLGGTDELAAAHAYIRRHLFTRAGKPQQVHQLNEERVAVLVLQQLLRSRSTSADRITFLAEVLAAYQIQWPAHRVREAAPGQAAELHSKVGMEIAAQAVLARVARWLQLGKRTAEDPETMQALLLSLPIAELVEVLRSLPGLSTSAETALLALPVPHLETILQTLAGVQQPFWTQLRREWQTISSRLGLPTRAHAALEKLVLAKLLAWMHAHAAAPRAHIHRLLRMLLTLRLPVEGGPVNALLTRMVALDGALARSPLTLPWEDALRELTFALPPTSWQETLPLQDSANAAASSFPIVKARFSKQFAPQRKPKAKASTESESQKLDSAGEFSPSRQLNILSPERPQEGQTQAITPQFSPPFSRRQAPARTRETPDLVLPMWWMGLQMTQRDSLRGTVPASIPPGDPVPEVVEAFHPAALEGLLQRWEPGAGDSSEAEVLVALGAWSNDSRLPAALAGLPEALRMRLLDLIAPAHRVFLQEMADVLARLKELSAADIPVGEVYWEAVMRVLLHVPAARLSRDGLRARVLGSRQIAIREVVLALAPDVLQADWVAFLSAESRTASPHPLLELIALLQSDATFSDLRLPEWEEHWPPAPGADTPADSMAGQFLSTPAHPQFAGNESSAIDQPNLTAPPMVDPEEEGAAPLNALTPPQDLPSTQIAPLLLETPTPSTDTSERENILRDRLREAFPDEDAAADLEMDKALDTWLYRLATLNQVALADLLPRLRAAVAAAALPGASRLRALLAPRPWSPRPLLDRPTRPPGTVALQQLLESALARPAEWPGLALLIDLWSTQPVFAQQLAALPDPTIAHLLARLRPGHARFVQGLVQDSQRISAQLRRSYGHPALARQAVWAHLFPILLAPATEKALQSTLLHAILELLPGTVSQVRAVVQPLMRQLQWGRLLFTHLEDAPAPQAPPAHEDLRAYLLRGVLPPGTDSAAMAERLLEMAVQRPRQTAHLLTSIAPPARMAAALHMLLPAEALLRLVAALSATSTDLLQVALAEADQAARQSTAFARIGAALRVQLLLLSLQQVRVSGAADLLEKATVQAIEELGGNPVTQWAELAGLTDLPVLSRIAGRVLQKLALFFVAAQAAAPKLADPGDLTEVAAFLADGGVPPEAAALHAWVQTGRTQRQALLKALRGKDDRATQLRQRLSPADSALLLVEALGRPALLLSDLSLLALAVKQAGGKRAEVQRMWQQWLEWALPRRQSPERILTRWLAAQRIGPSGEWRIWRAQLDRMAPLLDAPESHELILQAIVALAPASPATPARRREDSRSPNLPLEIPNLAEYAVPNAGVALLWPFFPRYFDVLGLMKAGSFKNRAAQERAAFLLPYLCHGQTRPHELDLVLPKVFCGLDPAAVLRTRSIRPKQQEKEVTESLLSAAIQHWTTLGDTSVPAFQESFLDRPGVLRVREQGFHLEVENRSHDLLLRTLPWGLNPVNLSWMTMLMEIEWSSKI